MWIKEPVAQDMILCSLLYEENNCSLQMIREENKLLFSLGNLKSKDPHLIREVSKEVDLKTWTHIAIQQSRQQEVQILINFEKVAEFAGQNFGFGSLIDKNCENFSFLHAINAEKIDATEVRLWNVNLSAKQLKNMAKQPLSILYEQRRNLNIKINKSKTQAKSRDSALAPKEAGPDRREESKVDAVPKKKKGGLKFTSKLDAKKNMAT